MSNLRLLFIALLIQLPVLTLEGATSTLPPAPTGLYLLNDKQTPISNMKLPSFLSGYTLRIGWSDLEKSKGVYDFKLIGSTVTYLQAHNLKMTLEIFASVPPSYILAGASSTFPTATGMAPAPWDSFAQARWKALLVALSKYQVRNAVTKSNVALRDHPTLTAINAAVVGLQSIRDIKGDLVKKPDYTRAKFINAVAASITACRDAFPYDYPFVGFFRMQDADRESPLDEAVFARLQQDFMGTGRGGLGLFQETWSDEGPNPLGLGSFLVGVESPNAVMLQALTSWKRPFIDPQKVASQNPDAAMDSAFVDLGCRYFELYYPDVVASDLEPVFKDWAAFLAAQ